MFASKRHWLAELRASPAAGRPARRSDAMIRTAARGAPTPHHVQEM
jgi:hypothetical protein